jgi:hypothetical protein
MSEPAQQRADPRPVMVMRGESGPFAGVWLGEVLAYELVLPDAYQPRLRPGTTLIERVYVLLELDRHLHIGRFPVTGWTYFPPAAIAPLTALPAPLGPP